MALALHVSPGALPRMRLPKRFAFLLPLLAMTLGLAGCSSSIGNFTLSATPATVSLAAGASSQFSLTATATGGFNQPVAVTLTGLPTGVTASPSTLTLNPGTASTVTLAVASSVASANSTVTVTGTSGGLIRSATLTVTTAAAPPPADFSLSVSPTSQTVSIGDTGAQVTVLATPINGFTGPIAVTVSGLPTGVAISPATLSLSPGTPQTISVVASPMTTAGNATLTVTGTSGSLSHTATLAVSFTAKTSIPVASSIPDVTTYHYDKTRQGLNAHETALSPSTVNASTFGLLGIYQVDGKVDAQPLFAAGLSLQTGTSTHTVDVLFVATEHDTVYALNAATGAQVWKTSVLGANETPSDDHNCDQITPEIGITGTPVIDRAAGPHGTLFVVGMSKDSAGVSHQRLHALDLTTGAELSGSPSEITASFPGTGANSANGKVLFDPAQYAERVGLTLVNGNIYTAWTSHCDFAPYTGWVIGYNEHSLQQSAVLNLTPNGSDGSVWMSGYGLAADTTGNLYLLDANGTLDTGFTSAGFPSRGDFGNAILKLSTSPGLAVADFWEPFNTAAESDADKDLGSGGAMLLPDLTDAAGTIHHLLVGAGKDGNIYVADRDNLGKFNPADNSNLYQQIANALPNGAWSGPAYFNNTVFFGGVNDVLRAFTVTGGKLTTTPTSQSATSFAYPGATPAVSANGTQAGIVWAVESATNAAGVLHAYDATDLTRELYNSNQAPNKRDSFGNGNKFITPVIVNGQVFVGTQNSVAVFGLLSTRPATIN
jgi:hypothetical protein